jgi:hypothetical protein
MTADIERYRTNLRDELNGAALYAALAAAEVACPASMEDALATGMVALAL